MERDFDVRGISLSRMSGFRLELVLVRELFSVSGSIGRNFTEPGLNVIALMYRVKRRGLVDPARDEHLDQPLGHRLDLAERDSWESRWYRRGA